MVQGRLHGGDHLVGGDQRRIEDLATGEGQQLVGELHRATDGRLGGGDAIVVIDLAQLGGEQVEAAVDHRQRVVQLVGDATGQVTDGLDVAFVAEEGVGGGSGG